MLPIPPFGRDVIKTILPHREPFLLVDRVEALDPDRRIVCVKEIAEDEYYLVRAPGRAPVYPITLLAETVAQSGALLVLMRPGLSGRPIYFMAIDRFETTRDVHAGETVTIEAETVRMRTRFGSLKGVARVGGEEVARGVMRFAMELPGDGAGKAAT